MAGISVRYSERRQGCVPGSWTNGLEGTKRQPIFGLRSIRPARYHAGARGSRTPMSKPIIFTISATWDDEASVWSGHCDDVPAAADAPTLDELLAKISAMTLDLLPDNHPGVDPSSVFLQITALREAEPAVA